MGRKSGTSKEIVCQMTHTTVPNYRDIRIVENTVDGKNELLLENLGNNKAKMIGEREIDDEYDYVIAMVNKKTGEVEFRPAELYNVSAQPVELLEARRGKSDFPQFEDQEVEKKATKRASLSQTFGDSKKLKALDKIDKREVQEETMVEMKDTAFASTSVIKKDEESFSIDRITAIKTEEISDVLPKANLQATFGRDVYPIELFITDVEMETFAEICEEMMGKSYEDFGYEARNETKNDFPPFYKELLDGKVKDSKLCTLNCFLAAMLYLIKISKGRQSISTQGTKNSPFPLAILDAIQAKYFKAQKTMTRKTVSVSVGKVESDRLLAHTIAFALSIDPENRIYPVEWSAYTRVSAPIIDKIALALGAHKEALPLAIKQHKGNYSLVLGGPPKPMTPSRGRKRR